MQVQVLLEEFGKWVNTSANASLADRDTYFRIFLDAAYQAISSGTALKVGLQEGFMRRVRLQMPKS